MAQEYEFANKLRDEIKRKIRKETPSYSLGTVTKLSPLMVRLDSSTTPCPVTKMDHVLSLNSRVLVLRDGTQYYVIGVL